MHDLADFTGRISNDNHPADHFDTAACRARTAAGEEEQKQQYKNDMKKALDRLFDQHIREREYHIQLINEELEELKEKLRSAKENKSEQVRTRLNQLINPTVFD